MKVLVIDDDPLSLSAMVRVIKYLGGFKCEGFDDPLIALEYIKNNNDFGVVISDQRMSGIDGIELLQIVSRLHPSVDLILMSGFLEWTSERAEANGINSFFQKPINPSDLLYEVSKSLTKNKQTNK